MDFPEDSYEINTTNNTTPVNDLDIEELRRRIYGESPEEFLSFSLRDSEVSLHITGSWKGSLQGSFGLFRTPIGFGLGSPETPLLFSQEADLTLSLWINDRWFVEANFVDDYDLNTYRAGYQGHPDDFVKYAGIGNTGLDFPSFPYLDLGGDSPTSFGFYGHMGTRGLDIHTLFRYDAASREERVFSGGRERIYSYLQPQDSISGISFVLPDVNIDSDITVYIEDEKGSLRDISGRRWRLASPNEYGAGRTEGFLELNIRPDGMVAVVYSKNGNNRPWLVSMGTYDGVQAGFLTDVQNWFDPGRILRLENYPQCGRGGQRPGEVVIGNVTALVIREPGTFSPFERRNRYQAPSSASEQAALVRISSGAEINGFQLVQLGTGTVSGDINFFVTAASARNIYELLPEGNSFTRRSPETCWPLAREFPNIYLPGAEIFTGDMILRFTNFSSATGYFIGADAVPGSIQVWRSGIQDANFSYNKSSGEVVLNGAVGQNELIRITYLRQAEETRLGSIAAGFGAIYRNGASPFSIQGALGIRWNLTESSAFTEEGVSSMGTVGLSGKTAWDYDFFRAHITAGLAFEQTDTTGLYRVAGMEGNETILALPYETSFLSHPPTSIAGLTVGNRADLIFRNYINTSAVGSTLMPVTWAGSTIIQELNRPYPVRDPLLGERQILAAEFILNSSQIWTGFEVPVGFDSEFFSRAVEIEIPYRFYDFSGDTSNLKLILQIGALSGKDFAIIENPDLILEKLLFSGGWEISPDINYDYSTNPHLFNQNGRIARFVLSNEDRLKLADARYLRVIAVYEGTGGISGRVLLAPPIIRGASFRPVTFDGNTISAIPVHEDIPGFSRINHVTAYETMETGINRLESVYGEIIQRLHPDEGTQRVLKISWENMQPGISAGADGRMGELPLSDYRELSFFVKGPEPSISGGRLSFYAASGPDAIFSSQLEAHIPLSEFMEGQWSKVTIRYQGNNRGVSVDGRNVEGAEFHYRPTRMQADGPAGRLGYTAILIDPLGAALPNGSTFIDEIILEDSLLVYRMNLGAGFQYSRPGTLLYAGGVPVFSDFLVSSALETEARTDGSGDMGFSPSMSNRTGAEILFLGTRVQGNLFSTVAKDTFLWSADHVISRRFAFFSFRDTFFASPLNRTAQHNFNMALTSPFYAGFDADALYEFSRLRQKWNFNTGYRSRNSFIPSLGINTDAVWMGRSQIEEDESYAGLWFRTWEPLVPDAGSGADSRRTSAQISITQNSRPVGAVLTVEGNTNFTGANNSTRLENSVFLDIPVILNRSMFNITAGRSFRTHLYFSGNDVFDDGNKFFESVNDSAPLWKFSPVYSLFTPRLNDTMEFVLDNSLSSDLAQYTAFSDQIGARISFPPIYTPASFILPSRMSLRLERVLEQKWDTKTDILNLGGSISFSSINMFGVMGYKPLFNFYHSDEYTHTIDGAVVFGAGDEISWRMRSVVGAGFRGFSGGVLSFVNTLTLRSGSYWLESFVADWTTPTQRSLLSIFYDWIARTALNQSSWFGFSSLLNSDYEQLRRESLELTIDKTGEHMRWSVMAGHESIIRILGRLEFTTFIRLRCSEDLYREIFRFDTFLGTSLRISF